MSIKEVTAENLASLFFHYQTALAPDFGCTTGESPDWETVPTNERQRMIAAARLTLLDLSNGESPKPSGQGRSRKDYIGEEGREWGC